MTITIGALLAAAMGGGAGWIDAYAIRGRREPPAPGVHAALGALIAGLAYAAFLAAGMLVSLVLFAGPPSPVPALLCTALCCVTYLGVSWLRTALEPRRAPPSTGAPGATWAPGAKQAPGATQAHPEMTWAPGMMWPPEPAARRSRAPWAAFETPTAVTGPVRWIVGFGLAALIVYYGLQCLWTRSGQVGSLLWRITLEGGPAIALGLGWTGAGMFLHLHFFYRDDPRWEALRRNGKLAALIAAFVGHSVAVGWGLLRQSAG